MSEELFRKLKKEVLDTKRLSIGIDRWKANRPGSPVFSESDYIVTFLIFAILIAINFYNWGWKWGILSLFCALILFFIYGSKWILYRVRKRTVSLVLSDYRNWSEFWDRGYLSLTNINFPNEPCLSPNDSWELFIQNLNIQDDGEVSKVIKKQTNQKGFFDELIDTIKSFIKWFVILVIIGGIIAIIFINNN